MELLLTYPWITVLGPALLALGIGVLGARTRPFVPYLAAIAPVSVLITGVMALSRVEHSEAYTGVFPTAPVAEGSLSWMFAGSERVLALGWAVDGLTALMLVVVGFVALMVMVFSAGYMEGDAGFARYYALLCLFTGSMSLLVIADGLLGLFLGWELVGACSYLLIGFWFQRRSAAQAAIKAFLTTRVGDVGLLLGIAVLWKATGRIGYVDVFSAVGDLAPATVTLVALLLFVGAAGKSAQFPLHIWLPDAMEGPTPVSALIHAATMVAAGVFLVARMWPLFELSEPARLVVLVIGAFTALAAATIALAQTDIKKVLAYSTISQLGFMFAALGAGAWVAAVFHLVTHAAFKALLFLGSGSVIHGAQTQDMREMGGLMRMMPVTAGTWFVGAAALAGIPPLAGFFSKDEVIHGVLAEQPVAGVALLIASLLTAFYITRATSLTFLGTYRGTHHPHEGGLAMTAPLVALAIPAALLGFAAHPIAEFLGHAGESLDLLTAGLSTGAALIGVTAGWFLYRDGVASEIDMESRAGALWPVLRGAYGFDAMVQLTIVIPALKASAWLYDVIDRKVVDAAVEGSARTVRRVGAGVARIQYGDAQWYAALLGAGFVLLAVITIVDWPGLFSRLQSWLGVG